MANRATNLAGGGLVVTETGRTHYLALDGLRGVAALMVVLFHQTSVLLEGKYLKHAYLAVDFFFILSGFVISYAYSQRLSSGMKIQRFAVERAIRLMPLLTLGAFIGASYFLFGLAGSTSLLKSLEIVCEIPFAITTIPFPFTSISKSPYELNGPEWSLFFEVIANIIFMCGLYRLSLRALSWTTAVFIIIRVMLDYTIGVPFWDHISIISCVTATSQVMSLFCLGMLMERAGLAGRLPVLYLPISILSLILVILFCFPFIRTLDTSIKSVMIYLIFPLIIVAACQRNISLTWARLAALSGAISYPIYILHNPILSWNYYLTERLGLTQLPAWTKILFATALCFAIAWVANRFYDLPLRKMLKRKILPPRPL